MQSGARAGALETKMKGSATRLRLALVLLVVAVVKIETKVDATTERIRSGEAHPVVCDDLPYEDVRISSGEKAQGDWVGAHGCCRLGKMHPMLSFFS